MRYCARIRSLRVCATIGILIAAGIYAYAEFTVQRDLDPNAEDNQLAERYEKIRLGMRYRDVCRIVGAPNVILGTKIGAAWSGDRRWAGQESALGGWHTQRAPRA